MPIRRVIDLSMPLDERTPFYPGDPKPRVCAATTIAADGFNVARLELGSHSGTHCDAPFHFLEDGLRLDALPLERFVGPGVVIDATGLPPRTAIGWDLIEPHAARLGPGAIVLLHTGWDAYRDSDAYFEHPFLDGEACAELLARGVRTVGLDAINLDETPRGELDRARFACHAQISAAGGVIVENLVGLGAVDFADPLISVLPLNVPGGDGAPARAVAIEGLA
jgi:kynurenine formamidase